MKKVSVIFLIVIVVAGGLYFFRRQLGFPDALSGASVSMVMYGNSLYHQKEMVVLEKGSLRIEGEVKSGGEVNLDKYYKHEIIVKESIFDPDSGIQFQGAYRYKGYSLLDLLHPFVLEKKNAETFRPQIDLYVVIENQEGDSVVFSWSEIFHTSLPHQIILATEAAPIVPHKKEVAYDPGRTWKVVAASDLFSFRSLINPVKITVKSFDQKEYKIDREIDPLSSEKVEVYVEKTHAGQIYPILDSSRYVRYYSTFYGMGMGYHPAKYFQGPLLASVLPPVPEGFDRKWNRTGLVCFAALDGYRTVYSFSELFNRNDQVFPILAITENPLDGGFYRIFHPSDFFADRSVKALTEIFFFRP